VTIGYHPASHALPNCTFWEAAAFKF